MAISAGKLRDLFKSFFTSKNHVNLGSSSIVPSDDDTLMFINSGMAPLKDFFNGSRSLPDGNKNAFSVQSCLRAGGKHNDLDNVGYTSRHHTMFEMLGNFSFGGYFKKEAIDYAWEFLTSKDFLGKYIEKSNLYFTTYIDDLESYKLWESKLKEGGLDIEKHLIKVDSEDNFWSVGSTGLCGPCTEIYYDLQSDKKHNFCFEEIDTGDRYVEIWNLVFTQFNKMPNGEMEPLKMKCVDTGMGLERVLSIIQGHSSNYSSDLFAIEDLMLKYSNSLVFNDLSEDKKVSVRVILDHARTLLFLASEGVFPSNEGRGYVLRRILRRSIRHLLNLSKDFALFNDHNKVIEHISKELISEYKHLDISKAKSVYNAEMEVFRGTLEKGLSILNKAIESGSSKVQDGSICFELYDTYGFPLDFTVNELRLRNIDVDKSAFDKLMLEQKERSKKDRSQKEAASNKELEIKLASLEGKTEFIGYEDHSCNAKVMSIINQNGQEIKKTTDQAHVYIVFNKTPYYPEGGGQFADSGYLKKPSGEVVGFVEDVKKQRSGVIVHKVKIESDLSVNDILFLEIDANKRAMIAANHSATHLLHAALSKVLNRYVYQKGSQVYEDKLRFDFDTKNSLSDDEVKQIELLINKTIQSAPAVQTSFMQIEEAKSKNIVGQFSDKYSEKVRVVSMGIDSEDTVFSAELCGGTHVSSLNQIACFIIKSQSSVGSGVKRIEAITGKAAVNYLYNLHSEDKEIRKNEGIAGGVSVKDFCSSKSKELNELYSEIFEVNKKIVMNNLDKEIIEIVKMKDKQEKLFIKFIRSTYPDKNIIVSYVSDGEKIIKVIKGQSKDCQGDFESKCRSISKQYKKDFNESQMKGFCVGFKI